MSVTVRPARTADVVAIEALIEPYVAERILLGKDAVVLYGSGLGTAIVGELEARARALGLERLFCLTFETDFFGRHGFEPIGEVGSDSNSVEIVSPEVYAELVRSPDEGVAEFLDLSRVKPNTLGNTRMLKSL
jgi:amino-acid N-acetyltransferase